MEKARSIPVYMQIVETIKQRIMADEFVSGTLLPREVDFAREFGVTRSTLRNALDVLEREGFIERRRSKGTIISPRVRHNKHLTPDLAIVTHLDLTNTKNYIDLLGGSGELGATIAAATKRGMIIRFVPWCSDARFFDLDEILFQKGIDGFIFVSPLRLTDFIDRVVEEKIPHVLLESHYDKRGVNTIMTDDFAATRKCVRKLFELGHRKIAFCGGLLKVPELNSAARRCFNAFLEACADFGILMQGDWIQIFGEDALKNIYVNEIPYVHSMLTSFPRPTAIVTTTIRSALAVKTVCDELNISIPEDMSLITLGINDSKYHSIECTGYAKDYNMLGDAALGSLMQWIANPLYRPECKMIMPNFVDYGTIAAVDEKSLKSEPKVSERLETV